MKYLKMLGLAAAAAAVLTALLGAGSAPAAVLCKVWANPCTKNMDYGVGQTLHSTLEPGTSVEFLTTGEEELSQCTGSTITGEVEAKGALNKPVVVKNTNVTYTGCTSKTETISNGKFSIEYAAGTNNTVGNLTAVGVQITISPFGLTCTYGTGPGLEVGIMASTKTSTYAWITIEKAISREEGVFFCPAQVIWKASYLITSPKPLHVKPKMEGE